MRLAYAAAAILLTLALLASSTALAGVEASDKLGIVVHLERDGQTVAVYRVDSRGSLDLLGVFKSVEAPLNDAQPVAVGGEAYLATCGPGGLALYLLPLFEPAAVVELPCAALDFPAALVYEEADSLAAHLYMALRRGDKLSLEPMAALYVTNAIRYSLEDAVAEPLAVVHYLKPLGVEAVVEVSSGGETWPALALYLPAEYAERITRLEAPAEGGVEVCSLEPSPDRSMAVMLVRDGLGDRRLLLLLPSMDRMYAAVPGADALNLSWAGWVNETMLIAVSETGSVYLLEPHTGEAVALNVTLSPPPGPCGDAAVMSLEAGTIIVYEDAAGVLHVATVENRTVAGGLSDTGATATVTTTVTTVIVEAVEHEAPQPAAPAAAALLAVLLILLLLLLL